MLLKLWLGFDPRPGNVHTPWVQPRKKKKHKTKRGSNMCSDAILLKDDSGRDSGQTRGRHGWEAITVARAWEQARGLGGGRGNKKQLSCEGPSAFDN